MGNQAAFSCRPTHSRQTGTFQDPPSERPAGSKEPAGGDGVGCSWTWMGDREGAPGDLRRHRRGVPPSVTCVLRVTGVQLRGRVDPGAPLGVAAPRHAGAAPGPAGPRYPSRPARELQPHGAGQGARGRS